MQVRKGSGVQPQVGEVLGKFVAAWYKVMDLDRFDVA